MPKKKIKKKWYHTWWGIILCVFIGLISLIILVSVLWSEEQTTTDKTSSPFQPPQQTNSNPTTKQQTVPVYHPTNINEFASASEGDVIRFYFLLEDNDGANTVGCGEASIQIKDSAGKVVFSQKFNFGTSDFVDYQFKISGQKIGKAFEWRVSQNDIQKGLSSTGTADLTLSMSDGKILKATDTYIQIPKYTEEEIKQLYEEKYLSTAKVSGSIITKGNFEVTLVRYGFYKHLKYNTWGDEVTEFRADVKIKNIGSEKDSLYTYDAVIISTPNQYERTYNSKLESSDVYPGIIKEGYLIFDGVPTTLSGTIKIIVGTSNTFSYPYYLTNTYEFDVQI